MSKLVVLWSWRYFKACSLIWDHLSFVVCLFVFFTAWICHLLFSQNNEICPLLFDKMYAVTLHLIIVMCFNDCGENGACYWTVMECSFSGEMVWLSKDSTQMKEWGRGDTPQWTDIKPWNATGNNIWPIMGAVHWTLCAPLWLQTSSADRNCWGLRRF